MFTARIVCHLRATFDKTPAICDIISDKKISATVTMNALENLEAEVGKEMLALIKSTQVMLAVED